MGKKVLIVDDAAFMRMMLKDILQKNDFEVVAEAENGKVGVAAYQKFKPDIVTMDITMPEMNGIDAVKAIKAVDANAKIVMVSAMGQQPMVIEAIPLFKLFMYIEKMMWKTHFLCHSFGFEDSIDSTTTLLSLETTFRHTIPRTISNAHHAITLTQKQYCR